MVGEPAGVRVEKHTVIDLHIWSYPRFAYASVYIATTCATNLMPAELILSYSSLRIDAARLGAKSWNVGM
jgi:hypothetical protein